MLSKKIEIKNDARNLKVIISEIQKEYPDMSIDIIIVQDVTIHNSRFDQIENKARTIVVVDEVPPILEETSNVAQTSDESAYAELSKKLVYTAVWFVYIALVCLILYLEFAK